MKYFQKAECIEDVKKIYKELIFQWHPDRNSSPDATRITQEINAEYETAYERYKNVYKNSEGETYTRTAGTDETAGQYREIIEKIIRFVDVKIELIGTWLWISGNTRTYKDILKELKFVWSHNKCAWSYHAEPYKKHNSKKYGMDEIRNMWGSSNIETQPDKAIA